MEEPNIIQILTDIVTPLLDVKEALLIKKVEQNSTEESNNEEVATSNEESEVGSDAEEPASKETKTENYVICLDNKDLHKFVLNKGSACNAIRDILFSISKSYKIKINVRFESLTEE